MSDLGNSFATAFKIMFIGAVLVTAIVTASVTYLVIRWTSPVPQVAPVTEIPE